MIEFKAIFGGAKIDKDGEVKLTFIVPQNQATNAIALTVLTEQVFDLKVEPEKK